MVQPKKYKFPPMRPRCAVDKISATWPTLLDSDQDGSVIKKIKSCCVSYDFNDKRKENLEGVVFKMKTLQELLVYVSTPDVKISESLLHKILNMSSVNLLRELPHPPSLAVETSDLNRKKEILEKALSLDPGVKNPSFDPAWPHLNLVYKILQGIVDDESFCVKGFHGHFVEKLINNALDSDDPRERESIANLLQSFWWRFNKCRYVIWKSLTQVFSRFIFESERYTGNGIGHLLDFVGDRLRQIIPSTPSLQEVNELNVFLNRILIPLHKPRCLALYIEPLTYCIRAYLEKDHNLSDSVILGILKYWPKSNPWKETSLMVGLENLLMGVPPQKFKRSMAPLVRRIVRCLTSSHCFVAESALSLLERTEFVEMLQWNSKFAMPIILGALQTAKNHWNDSVQDTAGRIFKDFSKASEVEICYKERTNCFQAVEAQDQELEPEAERRRLDGPTWAYVA